MSVAREMARLKKYEDWSISRQHSSWWSGPKFFVVTIFYGPGHFKPMGKGTGNRMDWAISRAIKAAKEQT